MTPERREQMRGAVQATRTGWRESVREVCWTFGMLDEHGNPSLIRAASVYLLVIGGHGTVAHERPLTGFDLWCLSLGGFATLGLKGMALYKDWRSTKGQASSSTTEGAA
jgi:hypothetical protein